MRLLSHPMGAIRAVHLPSPVSTAVRLGRSSVARWIDDGASSMGAALAFYSLLSMAPVLLMVITVAGVFFGEDAARGALIDELRDLFGPTGAQAVEAVLIAARQQDGSPPSLVIGAIMILVGATTVFAELQGDLDRIWRVQADQRPAVRHLVRARMVSFGLILGVGFLLAVSLVLTAAITAFGDFWSRWFIGAEVLLQALNTLLSFALITALFAMIYKLLPSVWIPWRDVWIGAALTSLMFALGKYLIGLYLGTAAISSSFGAAGALVAIVVWVYYSAQIFLLGAEFTHEYSRLHGSGVATRQDHAAASAQGARRSAPDAAKRGDPAARTTPPPGPASPEPRREPHG